jgi:predicted Zn-dependent protease
MKRFLFRFPVGVAVFILLCVACTTVPLTGRSQLSLIPAGQMSTMSADSYKQVLSESKISKDPQQSALVKRVGLRVAASCEHFLKENKLGGTIQYYQWAFTLLDEPKTVNAFCIPGGRIAVYSGILPYSRRHETEADRIGLTLMAKAGYDPQAAPSFWERMNQSGGQRPPAWLSTHPAPEQRIKDMKKFIPEAMKYYKPV